MADTSVPVPATPTADENRLSAAVARLRANIVDAHQFRPAEPERVEQFEKFMDDMLQTLIETSQAAAVDQAAILIAKDLSAQRQSFQLAAQRQRDQADIDSRQAGATILPSLMEVAAQAGIR